MKSATTKEYLKVRHGLLAPDGKLYACEFSGHIHLAGALHAKMKYPKVEDDDEEDDLIWNRGWWKLQNSFFVYDRRYYERHPWSRLTRHQRDTIFDWCEARGDKPPWHIEL